MATQHPDNASKLTWYSKPVVSTLAELKECYLCFSDFDIDEYNWDWEGKFVDEGVVDRLLHTHFNYFGKHPLGKDKFLTFRIPNPRVETQFRLARAFMVMVTSSQLGGSLGFKNPPIFEAILPLTETAEEIIDIQEAFRGLVGVEHKLLKMKDSIQNIEIIPLFEQVRTIMNSDEIIIKYLTLHKKKFGFKPEYLRPYCARSDPALNSGLVPTMLSVKFALSSYRKLERKEKIKLFPMLGTGSLPFRGGLAPDYIDESIDEYNGVATFTLQSAFRNDYPKSLVKKAISKLKKEMPTKVARVVNFDKEKIMKLIPLFEMPYQESIEKLAPIINTISKQFPKRRERLQHIGLFGYSRGIGKIKLPRAIPFTGSLYSLGIPPEIIGTGRGLAMARKMGSINIVLSLYKNVKKDLERAGYYLNKENVMLLAKKMGGWYDILDDIKNIEKELGIELGPKTEAHKKHYKLSQRIFNNLSNSKNITRLISEGGILRKSLG